MLASLARPENSGLLTPPQLEHVHAALSAAHQEALENSRKLPRLAALDCILFGDALSAATSMLELIHRRKDE